MQCLKCSLKCQWCFEG